MPNLVNANIGWTSILSRAHNFKGWYHYWSLKSRGYSIWKQPENITMIHNFLRLAGYYRRFVKDFFKISRPLIKLTPKQVKFKWDESSEASFRKLKRQLTTTLILALAEGSKNFVVNTNGSQEGLGCVLMQNGRVLAYKVNYSTHDLELAAIVFALKK